MIWGGTYVYLVVTELANFRSFVLFQPVDLDFGSKLIG